MLSQKETEDYEIPEIMKEDLLEKTDTRTECGHICKPPKNWNRYGKVKWMTNKWEEGWLMSGFLREEELCKREIRELLLKNRMDDVYWVEQKHVYIANE